MTPEERSQARLRKQMDALGSFLQEAKEAPLREEDFIVPATSGQAGGGGSFLSHSGSLPHLRPGTAGSPEVDGEGGEAQPSPRAYDIHKGIYLIRPTRKRRRRKRRKAGPVLYTTLRAEETAEARRRRRDEIRSKLHTEGKRVAKRPGSKQLRRPIARSTAAAPASPPPPPPPALHAPAPPAQPQKQGGQGLSDVAAAESQLDLLGDGAAAGPLGPLEPVPEATSGSDDGSEVEEEEEVGEASGSVDGGDDAESIEGDVPAEEVHEYNEAVDVTAATAASLATNSDAGDEDYDMRSESSVVPPEVPQDGELGDKPVDEAEAEPRKQPTPLPSVAEGDEAVSPPSPSAPRSARSAITLSSIATEDAEPARLAAVTAQERYYATMRDIDLADETVLTHEVSEAWVWVWCCMEEYLTHVYGWLWSQPPNSKARATR